MQIASQRVAITGLIVQRRKLRLVEAVSQWYCLSLEPVLIPQFQAACVRSFLLFFSSPTMLSLSPIF
jgi:hypothetical protein